MEYPPKYTGYGAFYTIDSIPDFLIIRGTKRNKETGEYVMVEDLCTDYPGVEDINATGRLYDGNPKWRTGVAWENNVDIGSGNSFGGEFLYEYLGRDIYFRTAYTLSKTDREGFATLFDGGKFHARFDRRHIFNMQGRWKGFSMAMTLQSGHWENGAPLTYQIHIPGLETDAEYYEGINNFQMPAVFRLDLGYELVFRTGRIEHTVKLGICNVTNHFNPFMLYFDPATESWKEIALLPIMPNFSWRVEF